MTVSNKGFSHIGLSTLDLDATRAFWEGVLGFPAVRCDVIKVTEGGEIRHIFFDTGAGQLMAWSHDTRGARQALERFNRVKGGDYEVHYLLGELYAADRDEERARLEFERALRLLPARPR